MHRSRIIQILNVPQRVRLESSLAAALLVGLFEHPAGLCPIAPDMRTIESPVEQKLVLCSIQGQDCSGAKGYTQTSLLRRNATLLARILRFRQTHGLDMQWRDHVSGSDQPQATACGAAAQSLRICTDRVEGEYLLYLGEIGSDSCLSSILKIHGEH